MAPTAFAYLNGLRHLWWVVLASLLLGVGLGLLGSSNVRPTIVTTGNALFTFRIDDPGDESAGAARGAEAAVAESRLSGYVQIARHSAQVRALLDSAGISGPATTLSPTGGFEDAGARALVAASQNGLVEVRVKNDELTQDESNRLVSDLSQEVVRQAVAIDAQQVIPSLQPDALITEPQAMQEPTSRLAKLALPMLVLLTVGFGLVYLIVWREGRIFGRRDLEERVGGRVLGDFNGRPADAMAIALALGRDWNDGAEALILAGGGDPSDSSEVGHAVAAAAHDLGLKVRYSPTGLDAETLRAATTAHIVALVVTYGKTTYSDLDRAGRTLAAITGADIALIGVGGQGAGI